MSKLLVLKLDGDNQQGVRVTLTIEGDNNCPVTEITGNLPPNPDLVTAIEQWQSNYRSFGESTRITDGKVTHGGHSMTRWILGCQKSDNDLRKHFNSWLLSESFRNIRDKCLQQFIPPHEVQLLIRTGSVSLLKLPWHVWDLVENYPIAEVAFGAPDSQPKITAKIPTLRSRVKILAILGNSSGINIQLDRQLLENLPDAETTFLVEPQRREINDQLWEQPWDILFFAGHSRTEGENGRIYINPTDSLTIAELRYALKNAVNNGLQLAIFNSCDGMGLAFELQQLHIPQIIVMREPVPDRVAQAFLTYFLPAFAKGKSLYLAQREAREKLQGLENEFPCASWLPVLFQNPATATRSWQELGRRPTNICPYRGLFSFREEDAPFFRGREVFTTSLVEAVQKQPLVAVIGSSGSGKSSVVFAGLVPRLHNSGFWRIISLRPGAKPLRALAAAFVEQKAFHLSQADQLLQIIQLADDLRQKDNVLASVIEEIVWSNPGLKLLLVADQFEELYTLCQDKQERQVFLDRLLEATQQTNFTLVLTLRADFLRQALEYRPIADALQYRDLKLGPMNRKELQTAIEQPAALFGVTLESGLTERILDAVSTEPGDLPLLEFALHELWAKQKDAQLTHAAYDEIGGVQAAVASYAEKVYSRLNELEKERAQRIFLQLVRPGEGTEDTRRLATRAEVGDDNWDVVKRLADDRLVVTGQDEATGEETVEIIHEALIQEWGTLREWMNANRQFRTWQERLKGAMREWETSNHDSGALLRGAPLAVAQEWLQKRTDELTSQERDFIQASVALRKREKSERERTRNYIILGLSVSLAFVSILAGWAWWNLNTNQKNAKLIASSANVEGLLGTDNLSAIIEGIKTGKQLQNLKRSWRALPETQMRVVTALQRVVYGIQEHKTLEGHSAPLSSVAWSPDGQTIVSASFDRTMKLWKRDGTLITTLTGHDAPVSAVRWSPDGQTIASASFDKTVKLWKRDGTLITTFTGHAAPVSAVAWSPDGQIIASGSVDKTVKLWKRDGTLMTTITGHTDVIFSVAWSPDGQTIASTSVDKTVKLWKRDGTLITTITGHSAPVLGVAWSPDGQTIASASGDRMIKLWKPDGTLITTITGHSDAVSAVAWSPDGQTIASAGFDKTVKLWKRNGTLITTFTGHSDIVAAVAWSPNGQTIASASKDKTMKLWKRYGTSIPTLTDHNNVVNSVAWSPDSQIIASATWDKTIKLWKRDGTLMTTITGHSDSVWGVAWSPDGQTIASASDDQTVKLWKRDGTLVTTLNGHSNPVWGVAWSPDGQIIASASGDKIFTSGEKTVKLWKRDGTLITTLNGHSHPVIGVAWSPDSQTIASASRDKTVKLWKRDGTLITTLAGHSATVSKVAWSPDGQTIASASYDRTVKLWKRDGTLITTLAGHSDTVSGVAWSPDGQTIASSSWDKTVKLWKRDGTLITTLTGHSDAVSGVSWSPNGQTIASSSWDKTVKLWNLNLDDLLARGCHRLGDYLKSKTDVSQSDRHLCDGVRTGK